MKDVWISPIGRTVFSITIILCIATIYFLTDKLKLRPLKEDDNIKKLDLIIYCIWVIFPPFWFLYEYVWLFPHKLNAPMVADFKYTQELASKIWSAFATLITAILLYKYGKKLS